MLCCQTSVLHKPRILWRSLLTSSKSAFVNLYALENPLNYEYSVPDHCVVEQAPCSLVCGIGPLALWSMKWLHFPSRKTVLEPWNSLSELVYLLYPEQSVLVFGTPRDNHNMGGIHSEAPFTVCLWPNMLC